ncbi:outer membrane lipoprotein-sorting protein [Methylomonas sp. AM2-LC]|uniref:outer membrane lipoprotein-sorting protein n=1 Tax=Methylomonas sp. AM2-LC TaxID=3153301 RepID=UPI0032666996
MKKYVYIALFTSLTFSAVCSHADETPEEKGMAIARETDRRDSGFGDSAYESIFTLRNEQGEESIREFSIKTLEVKDDGDKELGLFHKPADVQGTAVLTFSHGLQPDDQWLYLPVLKRVKRISSVNKSGPFVGSEFAFEDIASWEINKYTYRYLRDEVLDGQDCFVVENTPAYEYSGYSKQIEWVDKAMYQPRKIDYYDRKGDLLKTLSFSDYHQYLNQYWRASKLEMVNHQTGKSTVMARNQYQFRNGFKDSDFAENALKNVQ